MKTTQTKSWLLIRAAMVALLLGMATQVNAWGSLSLPSFDIAPGETKTLAIQFEAGLDYVAFQFDLYLPEGLTIVKQANGKPDLRFNEERKDDHTFSSAAQTDGALRVFGVSLNNSIFRGTSGDFVYFTVTAADDFDGSHEVKLKKVMFSTAQGQRDEMSEAVATATARHWTFNAETGHLFVNDDYVDEYVPWESHKTEIKTVEFGHNVTRIGSYAFFECSLTSVTIPEGVTSIGSSAFAYCGLTAITIPEGVTSIANYTFFGCSSLTSITIPESVTSIGGSAFAYCSRLTAITIPEGVTSIESCTFYNCRSLTAITIPDGVTSIGEEAFRDCFAFTNITIPESVTSMGVGAFRGCTDMVSITLPSGLTSIEGYTFYDCYKLTNITIPEGVTSIGEGAFSNCSSLTSITIPEGVTSIGQSAFEDCSNLKTVINLSDLDIEAGSENHGFVAYYAEKVWTPGVHLDCTERGLLVDDQFTLEATVIPAGPSVEWSTSDASIATVDNGVVTGVGEGTAVITATAGGYSASCTVTVSKKVIPVTGIELNQASATIIIGNTLTLEATVTPADATDKTVIWSSNNESVATVDANGVVRPIADGTATITATAGDCSATCTVTVKGWSFDEATGKLYVNKNYYYSPESYPWHDVRELIISVEFRPNVTSIGEYAFSGCSSLTSINIPSGVTSIGEGVFANCSKLTNITIPEGVTSIGDIAFANCSSLTSINIPSGVTSIGNDAFHRCYALESITIPEGVTSIGNEAFENCSALTSVSIPNSVTSIGYRAFRNCSSLTSITIPEGVTSIENNAFSGCSSLTSVTIPEGVTSIGQGAFEDCSNLKTVINLSDLDIEAGSENHGFVAYYAEKVWTRGVHLDCTERGLLVGDQFTLEATVIPAGPSVTWSSSNESVATVDNGVVTGVAAGEATITASAGNYSATCTVTVSKKVIPVTGIELNKTSATIIIGNTLTLEATVYPGDATDKTVTWASSDEWVATVNANGVVTPNHDGNVTITATAGNCSATCTVTVEAAVVEPEPEPEGLVVGKNYRIKNVSAELYLQASSNNTNMQLHAQGEKLSQIFQLEMAEEGKYYIKVADAENSYYAHASVWNFNATTNADNKTPFTIELVENEEAVYTLHQATSGNPGYVGADATSEGASVYCDKGIGNNGKWTFEAVADDEYIAILRAELGAAIDGANDVVNTRSTILSTEEVDAINTAVAPAENLKDNLDDWATLNTLFKEINDAVCGAIYVNDLNELSNNVCYVVSTEDRGSWYSDSDAERLNSTTKLGVPFDVTNPKQQFAFITPDNGTTYYLYSVSEKKFVSEEMVEEIVEDKNRTMGYTKLTDEPVQTITFLNGTRSEAFPWVVALNTGAGEKQIAVSNSYAYGVITYNHLGDAGNTVRIEKAAAFDPAEALVHFVTGVELNLTKDTLTVGEAMALTATIAPNTIDGITVEWTTSDAAIATVEDGVVTAVAAGTATITATVGSHWATCNVTVKAAVVEPEPELEGIASISELSNDKLYLVAQLKRGNTAWAVAENGEALKSNVDLGINVDTEDSRQHFALIKYNDKFYLYHAAEKMFVSKDGSLNVQPVDAINITESTVFAGTFVMYFDDMHYINVDGNGYMAVNDWTDHDGGNSCTIIPVGDFDPTEALKAFVVEVSDVTLNKASVTLKEGDSETLTATVSPSDATDKTVEWSTSDATVATVEDGVVTAVAAGTATITATAGNHSATCVVTVEAEVVEPEPEPEPEGISSISELSNDKLYLVAQLKRGNTAWAVAENGEALKSNVDLSIGVDAEDSRQHFAFIKHNDRFYLYHAAEKMFVSKDGSLNVQPVDAINITSSTVFDGTFVMYFDDMHYINVDSNGYMAVNNWTDHDGGNSCSIIPVGDFDPTEALKALENLDTRIENAELNAQCSLLIYDLTGRRVLSTENLKGGIYIVNGKKVIVK